MAAFPPDRPRRHLSDSARRLVFARGSLRVVHRTGHLELLSSPVVAEQLKQWLAAVPPASAD